MNPLVPDSIVALCDTVQPPLADKTVSLFFIRSMIFGRLIPHTRVRISSPSSSVRRQISPFLTRSENGKVAFRYQSDRSPRLCTDKNRSLETLVIDITLEARCYIPRSSNCYAFNNRTIKSLFDNTLTLAFFY